MLDNLPLLHDIQSGAEVSGNRQIMGDEDHCETEFMLQTGDRVDDLPLNGDIQGGCRLIAEQNAGLAGKSQCDNNTLTLAT